MKECYLEINAKNLKSNYQWYKSQTLSPFVCPMLKANAYGAGEASVLKILRTAGANFVGVARVSEGLSLRVLDTNVGILVLNPCDKKEYIEILKNKITPIISSLSSWEELVKALEEIQVDSCEVHLELETGMNRLGFQEHDLEELFSKLRVQQKIKVAGAFSHLLQAEDWPRMDGRSFKQLKTFEKMTKKIEGFLVENKFLQSKNPPVFHLSSSRSLNDLGVADSNNKLLTQFGLRPGIGLYGVSQKNSALKNVLSMKAPIVQLKWVEKGETVSYDGIWTAGRRSLIGTLPIGYADGYPRALAGNTYVLVKGKKAPVVGKICMDFMMIDLTDFVNENQTDLSSQTASDLTLKKLLEEDVLVFGEDGDFSISLDELAERSGMITYEFMTGIGARVKRLIVEK